jgi:hypothetical protein
MRGTPIVSVTFDRPMLFDMYASVEKDGNVTCLTNAVVINYKKFLSTVPLSHGQVLIWKARDDERYMHVLFQKGGCDKTSDSVLWVSLVFRWVVGRGNYYIDGPKDGYPVENKKLGQMVVRTGGIE